MDDVLQTKIERRSEWKVECGNMLDSESGNECEMKTHSAGLLALRNDREVRIYIRWKCSRVIGTVATKQKALLRK